MKQDGLITNRKYLKNKYKYGTNCGEHEERIYKRIKRIKKGQ